MTRFHRVVSERDITELVRLAHEIWTEHYVPIIGQAQVDYMLGKFQSADAIAGQIRDGCEYYFVEHEQAPVGYMAVLPHTAQGGALLSKIYVRRDRRGLGLGKAALAFAVRLCRSRGIGSLWLTVNRHNLHSVEWYERMGFVNAGPVVQDIGNGFVMDDFRMKKSVESGKGAVKE